MQKPVSQTINLVFWDKDKHYGQNQNFVVPNMAAFVRDVTEHGNIGAIVKRALKLSPSSLIKMAWWNKFNLFKLLKKDFATGVGILIQMEVLQILKYRPFMIALTDQVTDLAVALKNTAIIKGYLGTMQSVSMKGGVVTNNLVEAAGVMGRLNVKHCKVITPFNSFGYEMNPNQTEVEMMVKLMDPDTIYAISPLDSETEDKYLKRFGINQKVVKWF